MRKFLSVIFVSFLVVFPAFGNWNDSFDEISDELVYSFPRLGCRKYTEDCASFIKLRKKCLQNESLLRKIAKMSDSKSELIFLPKEKIILKKRKHNHIYELFAWEISTLLGIDSCIVPSFAFEIGGKKVIMQKMEFFSIGEKETDIPSSFYLNRVSLENYWRAHLWAYLLGIKDLSGKNIGVNEDGEIRLFDVGSCFNYQHRPKRDKGAFHTGFFLQSLGWPHYRQPLEERTVIALRRFIDALSCMEDDIELYLLYRPFPFDKDGFLRRLDTLRDFYFESGTTFCDFYSFLFPRVGKGFDSLCKILGRALDRKIDHADALLFCRQGCKKGDLAEKNRKEFENWMNSYID